MKKQNERLGQSDSRKRVNSIFQEEEALSKAFEITNFYTNQRLNIGQLKQRLEQFKKSQKPQPASKQFQTPQKKNLPFINQIISDDIEQQPINSHSTAKFMNISDKNQKETQPSRSLNKNILSNLYGKQKQEQQPSRQTIHVNGTDRTFSIERREQARQANYRIVQEVHKSRYEPKVRTAFGARNKQSIEPVNGIVLSRFNARNKNKAEKTESSKHSDSSHNRSWSEAKLQRIIKVETSRHLNQLEKEIHYLWQHYQLLTKILLSLREGNRQQKNTIVKYVQDICSDRFQFVRDLLSDIQKENSSRNQSSFMKRITKGIILSRLYQNLSLVYVSMDICLKIQPDSHLVNFVGYCCSNIIFLLRFVELSHSIAESLRYSQHTENILAVIEQFQEESYKSKVVRVGDLILRMQHNNQIISIVQQRICSKMNKEFQQIIVNFLKNVDMETKPLLQYAHYIYQFLSFHLAKLNIIGQFSFVEMAPTPYLSLAKQKTLIIEPWEVLFALKGDNTYIRAYSETLLSEVEKYWNIVYWTDLMPDQVDDLIEKLPLGSKLYRYHCRYENDKFLKLLWRIGCDVDNTIIIDREEANFKYDREMGLELPWRGKNKDSKLLELLNFLLPLLDTPSIPLRKSFPSVKERILSEEKKSRHKRRSDVRSSVHNQSRNESLLPRHLTGK